MEPVSDLRLLLASRYPLVVAQAHDEPRLLFVFRDFCTFLQNPVVARRVKELAQAARPGQTVVLTGPRPEIPPELSDLALRWTLPPLDHDGLAGVVRQTLDELAVQGTRVS